MEFVSTPIGKRLAQCRVRRKQSIAKEEKDRLLAEEEGLLDAMLGRNRLDKYGQDQQSRRENYELGLLDGEILMGLQRWSYRRQLIVNNFKQWWDAHNPLSR